MARIETTRPDRVPGHKRNRVAATLAALAATMLAAAPADAGTQVSLTPHGFGAVPLEVITEDGKTWTKIRDAVLPLSVTIGIGRTDESVTAYYIRQTGQQGNYLNNDGHLLKEFFNPPRVRVDKDLTVLGHTNHLTGAEKQGILALCNSQLGTGNGIHQTHNLVTGVDMELIGHFTNSMPVGQGNAGGHPGQKRSGYAQVPVHCLGVPARPGGLATQEPKELKVGSIELFRSTYSHANSQPNPATVCKKARWLVRLNTNKAGPVKFKLWTQIAGGPITSKVVDAWSSFDGPGKFKAEYSEWTEVAATSFVQAMAEDMTNPIGQSTGWKSITLHCTGAGGGGLADVPRPDPDGPITQPLKVSGELTLADQDGVPKDQPRDGQAVFKIWASKPGSTSYRLTCSGGREWSGTLPTHKIADQKYQAVGAHLIRITKTEQIGCALRSTSLPNNDVIAVATRLYEVIRRNPDVAGPADLGVPPRPQTNAGSPRLVAPGIKTAPPRLTCIGGKSTGTACFCPSPTVKVQTGPNAYVCNMDRLTTGDQRPAPRRPAQLRGNEAQPNAVAPRQDSARPSVRGQRESALGQRRFMR